jgi:hypothetical protein
MIIQAAMQAPQVAILARSIRGVIPFHFIDALRITSLQDFRSSTTAPTRNERRVEAIVSLPGFRLAGPSAPSGTLRRRLRAA